MLRLPATLPASAQTRPACAYAYVYIRIHVRVCHICRYIYICKYRTHCASAPSSSHSAYFCADSSCTRIYKINQYTHTHARTHTYIAYCASAPSSSHSACFCADSSCMRASPASAAVCSSSPSESPASGVMWAAALRAAAESGSDSASALKRLSCSAPTILRTSLLNSASSCDNKANGRVTLNPSKSRHFTI